MTNRYQITFQPVVIDAESAEDALQQLQTMGPKFKAEFKGAIIGTLLCDDLPEVPRGYDLHCLDFGMKDGNVVSHWIIAPALDESKISGCEQQIQTHEFELDDVEEYLRALATANTTWKAVCHDWTRNKNFWAPISETLES